VLQIMKIGISSHHTYGGSGVVATDLGTALAMKGYTVHFFTQAAPFRLLVGYIAADFEAT